MPSQVCPVCATAFHVKPSYVGRVTYCNKVCMAAGYARRMAGSGNPNYKGAGLHRCRGCAETFRNYNKGRLFCSRACHLRFRREHPVPTRQNPDRTYPQARKDGNHDEIVAALLAHGVSVIDAHAIGGGAPDLIADTADGGIRLLEIKNPATEYGRQGLAPSQRRWAEKWQGSQAVVVYTVAQALRAVGVRVS